METNDANDDNIRIRERVHRAREAGHDTLGFTSDSEVRALVEFVALERALTERLVEECTAGAEASAEDAFVWQPIATTLLRAMIRELAVRAQCAAEVSTGVSLNDADIRSVINGVLPPFKARELAIPVEQITAVQEAIVAFFTDRSRFAKPTPLGFRGVVYLLHRDGDKFVVRGCTDDVYAANGGA